MTIGDIEERIENEKTHLQQLELNHSVSPLDNPVKIRYCTLNDNFASKAITKIIIGDGDKKS